MADSEFILGTYSNEIEANLDASILDANGIPSRLSSDNAGGAYPSMSIIFPIRLLVRPEDAALAREILDTPADSAPGADEPSP